MESTKLNLLAVSVFAFTLLSLVGPLLNISPAAVAIALTGCAGIITLDRFTWQNKGSTLLLDLVSSQSSDYRQRILHHEAGHFLAAHLLDIPIESYTLSAWQGIKAGLPGMGGVVVSTATPTAKQENNPEETQAPSDTFSTQQVNRYSIIWMAGIAAETQTYGTAEGGNDDRAKLRQFWQQFTPAGRLASEADTQARWALLQANTLIAKQQHAYQALVKAMSEQAPVATCCAQIEANKVPD